MSGEEGVDKLFFELASESRQDILRELEAKGLKMQEIARRLDLTATEAFRQLGRMSEALLIRRSPDGSYSLTEYGRLVHRLSPSFEFVHQHREFFLAHDIWRLPPQFVRRIGELSSTFLVMDTMASIDRAQQMFIEAEDFAWGLAEGNSPEVIKPMMAERVSKGIEFKFLVPEHILRASPMPAEVPRNLEARGIPEVPAILVLNEKEAGAMFRFLDGRMDYAGFFGGDPEFMAWVRDLFLHYWDECGRR